MSKVTNKVLPRLTLVTAETLCRREVGSSKGLKREEGTPATIYIYRMQLGTLCVTIDNGWYALNGLFRMTVDSGYSQSITRYFNPNTLEEDFAFLDAERERARREELRDYVGAIGLEGCKKVLGLVAD